MALTFSEGEFSEKEQILQKTESTSDRMAGGGVDVFEQVTFPITLQIEIAALQAWP